MRKAKAKGKRTFPGEREKTIALPFSFDRRNVFLDSSAMSFPKTAPLFLAAMLLPPVFSMAEVNKAEQIAPDVYFHEGDLKVLGHCNNGWIVFDDYVLVIDGNFPS